MPNVDAGHYFLTVLAPVRADPVLVGGRMQSRRHALRAALDKMPTGERTVATENLGPENPFARNNFTHFARFFVLDDVVYNGRAPRDSVLAAILKASPLTPRKVDRLNVPFLVFVADFDVAGASDDAVRICLIRLWETMQEELTTIFQHCLGFDGVADAERFYAYIRKCQIETTMPFNDYWSVQPVLPVFNAKPFVFGFIAALALTFIGFFVFPPWFLLLGLLGLGGAAFMLYKNVMEEATRPFPVSAPPAPGSDLPTVLKALAVQRGFTAFAIDAQNMGDQDIYDAFGAFIAAARPDDLVNATQMPGVIGV